MQISTGSEDPDWSSNYRLLRKLYPEWEPNDELLREVWFRCWDKPHGIESHTVCHDLLREAIVEARQAHTWKEPNLELVSKFYRLKRVERLMKLQQEVQRNTAAYEMEQALQEHHQRIVKISDWTPARRDAAVQRVVERLAPMRKQTAKPVSEWSQLMTGLVVAADQEIFLAQ